MRGRVRRTAAQGAAVEAIGRSDCDAATLTLALTAQRAALVLVETAPDASILVGRKRELETFFSDIARVADALRSVHLVHGRSSRADREEELGVLVTAG
jgi:predicted membrane-bound mannosyltransferase